MEPFKQDDEVTPVLFRVARAKTIHGTDVDAIMPTIPGTSDPGTMTCYAHVGQHGSCDRGWLARTRPATPAEYADLKAELESAPYGYRFKVYQRIQRWMDAARMAELKRGYM